MWVLVLFAVFSMVVCILAFFRGAAADDEDVERFGPLNEPPEHHPIAEPHRAWEP